MDKLQRIEEMERQLAALKDEVAQEAKHKQWEPEGGKFFVRGDGSTKEFYSTRDCRLFGTERKTLEQAEKAAAAMRTHNRLLAYVAEFAPDYEFSFGRENWYVYKLDNGKFCAGADQHLMDIGKVYMPKYVAEELSRKLNSGEVVL